LIRGQYRVGSEVRPGCTYRNKSPALGEIEWQKLSSFTKIRKTPKHSTSIILRFTFRSKKIPGLKKYDISMGAVGAPTGPSGIHPVATLYFDSADALKAGLASAEGKAAAGDLANFADGGAELYFFDTKEV
jgi:uncharacterized protein (TIGR02118 family)